MEDRSSRTGCIFLSWDHRDDKRPLLIADIHGTDDEKTYGITKENLDKFLAIAREKYGVAASPQTGSFDKKESPTVYSVVLIGN